MFDDANMRSELYPFFRIAHALLNDFESFALCMSDRLYDLAHRSTASPSLLVESVVAVEFANYNMRHVSASRWREQELFSWWFVYGMYYYTG